MPVPWLTPGVITPSRQGGDSASLPSPVLCWPGWVYSNYENGLVPIFRGDERFGEEGWQGLHDCGCFDADADYLAY